MSNQLKESVESILNNLRTAVKIPIGISNKHIHLTKEDFQKLFPNQEMTMLKPLKQPGEFASNQTVTVIGPKGNLENVRILGPYRKQSQIELAITDARKIGMKLPIRLSGDIENTPGVKLKSSFGECVLEKGAIIAKRHIHLSPVDAQLLKVSQGQCVAVRIDGQDRNMILDDCIIRIGDNFKLEMHIDTDEANAGNITPNSVATFLER
ncbi:propanediol utilization protein [Niallia circulans]|jgi:phosphate propanoyltransferase|uniref:phosphate propanoyltransferase n=1 Tax=Niallia circulans TaxID=1397 RepID=UPI000BA79EE5|nr:phosphate propanoyltransferase [Niallia circulans]PAD88058.1 propanediol utilization protein [Niallia circulans]